MKSIVLSLMLVIGVGLPANGRAEILTFKEWKLQQILEAQRYGQTVKKQLKQQNHNRRLRRIVASSRPQKSTESLVAEPTQGDLVMETLELQSQQAEANIRTSQSLGIQDYFEIYLHQQPDSKRAFEEISEKLTNSEMAELLLAYSRHLSDDR